MKTWATVGLIFLTIQNLAWMAFYFLEGDWRAQKELQPMTFFFHVAYPTFGLWSVIVVVMYAFRSF